MKNNMTKKMITLTMIGALTVGGTSSVFAQEDDSWLNAVESFLYDLSDNIDDLSEEDKEMISKLPSAILSQLSEEDRKTIEELGEAAYEEILNAMENNYSWDDTEREESTLEELKEQDGFLLNIPEESSILYCTHKTLNDGVVASEISFSDGERTFYCSMIPTDEEELTLREDISVYLVLSEGSGELKEATVKDMPAVTFTVGGFGSVEWLDTENGCLYCVDYMGKIPEDFNMDEMEPVTSEDMVALAEALL